MKQKTTTNSPKINKNLSTNTPRLSLSYYNHAYIQLLLNKECQSLLELLLLFAQERLFFIKITIIRET